MAAPTYDKDLVDITTAESTTGWSALGGGASGLSASPDLSMQGTNCVDKQITAAEKGQIFDWGARITPGASEHFFVWAFVGTPGLTATIANRGLAIVAGTATNAYVQFHVEGNLTYGAGGRVGKCYAIRYNNTTSASPPYRTLTGAPGADPQYFGATVNITASVKGANLGVDAIRRGTGIYITGGDGATPATFTGAAAQSDAVANRWGVLTKLADSLFEMKGRLVIGQQGLLGTPYTPTAARFDAANRYVLFADTIHSAADFTQFIVDHDATIVNLTNVTFEAAGTNNPGRFVVNDASSTVALTDCQFNKTGITTLRPGCTVTGGAWRTAGDVTQNSATISGARFNGTKLVANDTSKLSGSTFVLSGTHHGIEGFSTAGTYTLTGLTFTGFGADGTASAAVHVLATSGTVNLNVSGGTTPTVKSDGATVNVSASVTVTVTANVSLNGAECRVYDLDGTPAGSLGTELAGVESNTGATYAFSGSAANVVWLQVMLNGYVEFGTQLTIPTTSGSYPITLTADNNI